MDLSDEMAAWRHIRGCKHADRTSPHNLVVDALRSGFRLFKVDSSPEVRIDELSGWESKDAVPGDFANLVEDEDGGRRVDLLIRGDIALDVTITSAHHQVPVASRGAYPGSTADHYGSLKLNR